MSVKLEHVAALVALERMWIYARTYSTCEKDRMSHTILTGGAVTYQATDSGGRFIGLTLVTPEDDNPVTLVTEENF